MIATNEVAEAEMILNGWVDSFPALVAGVMLGFTAAVVLDSLIETMESGKIGSSVTTMLAGFFGLCAFIITHNATTEIWSAILFFLLALIVTPLAISTLRGLFR